MWFLDLLKRYPLQMVTHLCVVMLLITQGKVLPELEGKRNSRRFFLNQLASLCQRLSCHSSKKELVTYHGWWFHRKCAVCSQMIWLQRLRKQVPVLPIFQSPWKIWSNQTRRNVWNLQHEDWSHACEVKPENVNVSKNFSTNLFMKSVVKSEEKMAQSVVIKYFKGAVFASGNELKLSRWFGTASVEFVFQDHRDAMSWTRRKSRVLSYAFELKEFENKTMEGAIVELLDDWLGLSRRLYENRWPNFTSSLWRLLSSIFLTFLPEFPGAHGIEDAWECERGPVWRDYSLGGFWRWYRKVIKQVHCATASDTIESFEERIHEAEYRLYPEVLDSLGAEKIKRNQKLIYDGQHQKGGFYGSIWFSKRNLLMKKVNEKMKTKLLLSWKYER